MQSFSRFCFLLMLVLCYTSCTSQSSSPFAPETGVYTGSTLQTTGTLNYSYNPITGFGVQPGTSTTPGVNLAGDLSIKNSWANRGTYSLSKLKDWKGEWTYDAAKDQLSFTGPLKDALQYYHAGKGRYELRFLLQPDPAAREGVVYWFTKKSNKPFPKPARPNRSLTGLFTVKPGINTVAFFDAATGRIQKSFNGKVTATNAKHQTIDIGFTSSTSYYEIVVTDANGQTTLYDPATIQSWSWKFSHYQYGILNSDGSKMALMGKTTDNYTNLNFTPGENVIAVVDRKGNILGMLPFEPNQYVIPSFLPNGRLVFCPRNGGLAISDASYRQGATIYPNRVNAFTLSPDGKKIFFSEGLHFYTMQTDGTNKQQVVCGGEKLEADNAGNVITMACSPDGKQVAVNYRVTGGYGILIVPLDGSAYWFLKDDEGEMYRHQGAMLSWH